MNIIAIGGGSVGEGETRLIDSELVRLAGVPNPKLLFIPTASGDDPEYIALIKRVYTGLGCQVGALRLLSSGCTAEIARESILSADAIYVGGGNTKAMLTIWRQFGVVDALREHLEAGKPAGGLSAGAICWFKMGNSDWPIYEGIPGVNTAPLEAMGFVDLVLCPHTKHEEFRLSEFREMMKEVGGVGLGLDDNCALEILGEKYRILASQPDSVARRIEWSGGVLFEQVLVPHDDLFPLQSLTERAYS